MCILDSPYPTNYHSCQHIHTFYSDHFSKEHISNCRLNHIRPNIINTLLYHQPPHSDPVIFSTCIKLLSNIPTHTMCIDHKDLLNSNIAEVFDILSFYPNNNHSHTSSIFHQDRYQCNAKANNIHLESNNIHPDIWCICPYRSLVHSMEGIWHIYMCYLNSIHFGILCICRTSRLLDNSKEVFRTFQFLSNSIHCGIWCIFQMNRLKRS